MGAGHKQTCRVSVRNKVDGHVQVFYMGEKQNIYFFLPEIRDKQQQPKGEAFPVLFTENKV